MFSSRWLRTCHRLALALFAVALIPLALAGCPAIPSPFAAITGGGEEAITTNINDAWPAYPMPANAFADYEPTAVDTLTLPRGYYAIPLQSYCLHAGTHGPTSGSGYLFAPLKGPYSNHVRAILKNSVDHPMLLQQIVQRLIWSIEAGVNFLDLGPDEQAAASLLLPGELLIDLQSPRKMILEAATSAMPGLMGELATALTDPSRPFEDIERLAVLLGDPDTEDTVDVSDGTWTLTGAGVYWRVFPEGYSYTRAELYRPYPIDVRRDELGRITRYELLDGRDMWIETEYQEDPGTVVGPDGTEYPTWNFAAIRYNGTDDETGEPIVISIENEGWIFQPGTDVPLDDVSAGNRFDQWGDSAARLVSMQPSGGRWGDRVGRARDAYDQASWARDQYDRASRPIGEQDVRDLTDMGHYQDGLETATNPGDVAGRAKWIGDHQTRVTRGWLHAIKALAGLTDETDDGDADPDVPFDPTGGVATPGNTGRQRLGVSARTATGW